MNLKAMERGLGCCTVAEHVFEINTCTKTIEQRYYTVSPFKQKIINQEIDSMLSEGIIGAFTVPCKGLQI